ncbi:MAG: hypothetical protein Q4G13_07825 [Moraxella sp.]|nr:hypothetical protein [Moraxella sp.]
MTLDTNHHQSRNAAVRQILTNKPKTSTLDVTLTTRQPAHHATPTMLTPDILLSLRQPRSQSYLESLAKLDAGTHHHNQQAIDELKASISSELPIDVSGLLIGVVSKCYLGHPYEVHTLDFFGDIIEHYKTHETMRDELEQARSLAASGSYACIEVYRGKMIAIGHDGKTAVLQAV